LALMEAHSFGVVHRDLKPANLFFDGRSRQIKVLDFGVALVNLAIRPDLTREGSFVGTLAYSSPEQLAGANVTQRSDIWALGAILYELISGVPAFPEPYPELLVSIQQRQPRPLSELRPEVSAGLAACIAQCLAKDPQARFPDAETLIRQLAPFGGTESRAIRERLSGEPDAARSQPPSAPGDALPDFHSEEQLLEAVLSPRLAPGGAPRRVVFMLGAGFSMPSMKQRGVPGTDDIVRLIEKQLSARQQSELRQRLEVSSNKYQDAFEFLASIRNTDTANAVIRRAVLSAYRGKTELPDAALDQESKCKEYESAVDGWSMPEGVAHLGAIIARGLARAPANPGQPSVYRRFSQMHLTTNFDPLLAISTRRHGASCLAYTVTKDFDIPDPEPEVCLVVHLHGRWNKGDTLHNSLAAPREQLERSLGDHLERSVLVVLGYGGWDDVFTRTLKQIARGRNTLDVLWGFFSNDPREILERQAPLVLQLQRLGPRVQFYRGVDTNRFFQRLAAELEKLEPARSSTHSPTALDVGQQRPAAAQAQRRWLPAIAAGVLLIGGALLLRPASVPIDRKSPAARASVVPPPSVPLAQPKWSIRCEQPVPNGNIVLGSARIALAALCAGSEEAQLFLSDQPSLSGTSAALDPPHPFYSIEVRRNPREPVFELKRTLRKLVPLRLKGKDCAGIRRADVRVNGLAANIPARAVALPASGTDPNGADCEFTVSLPFEAFGKTLSFALQPSEYVANDVPFDATPVGVTVRKVPASAPTCSAKCRYIKGCTEQPAPGPCDLDAMARVQTCCSTVYPECRAQCD
jgi:hypothetical protein